MAVQVPADSPVVTVDAIINVLKAIADPTRFQLLSAVSEREWGVGQLAELTGSHVASVSQHLAKLRAAGLASARREGTHIYYRATNPQVAELLAEAGLVTGYVTGAIARPDEGQTGVASAVAVPPAWVVHGGRLHRAQAASER